jgi:hypothetical protein
VREAVIRALGKEHPGSLRRNRVMLEQGKERAGA